MVGFVRKTWKNLPPGVFIAMMGLLAALYPLLSQEPLSPVSKAIWTAVFFSLMVLEMVIIFRERNRQDVAFLSQISRLDSLRSADEAHSLALERVRRSVKNDGLRDRATRLSEALLEFVYNRLEKEPIVPLLGNRVRASDVLTGGKAGERERYQDETLVVYADRFSWKVLGVIEELEDRDIVDDGLRTTANSPSCAADLLFIGQRIGELAENVKD
jgi:hypothetical protein